MKTRDFIAAIRRSPEKQLIFENAEGVLVHSGYHLTEIKATVYDTVDCGGQKNRWNENIFQLWVPYDAENDYLIAGKFVRIYDKVRGLVSLDEESEVRIEYGDENFFPTTYHVADFNETDDSLRFLLEPPFTTCKARDRRRAGKPESYCA